MFHPINLCVHDNTFYVERVGPTDKRRMIFNEIGGERVQVLIASVIQNNTTAI